VNSQTRLSKRLEESLEACFVSMGYSLWFDFCPHSSSSSVVWRVSVPPCSILTWPTRTPLEPVFQLFRPSFSLRHLCP
jgi:hypothetical protein